MDGLNFQFMSVDDNLLNKRQDNEPEEEDYLDNDSENDDSQEEELEPQSLREATLMARARKNEKEKESIKLSEKANPIKKFSAQLLKSSWTNILPTFGFSVFGILANVILKLVFGDKFFCRLGDEWTFGTPVAAAGKKTKMINIAEPMAFALVMILLTLFILSILALVAMIVGFIKDPIMALKSILSGWFERWRD